MNKQIRKLLAITALTLTVANVFAANPKNVIVSLSNRGAFVAGLFYKTANDRHYQQANNWLSVGLFTETPVIPRKGSAFCVAILVGPSAYTNYYFVSNGPTPNWFRGETGRANLVFSGDLLFKGIHGDYSGTPTAGLFYTGHPVNSHTPCG